jgi:hypothetical protein
MASDMELDVVPVIYAGSFVMDYVKLLAEGNTTIGDASHWQIREGVVVEAGTGDRRKGKYVGEGYRLSQKED